MATPHRRPPGTTINDLPNELLDRIFGYFATDRVSDDVQADKVYVYITWWAHRRTLRDLVLVSKRFRHIAEPHLYRAFCYDVPREALRGFVQTLLARPDLARNVELVHLESWEAEHMSFEDDCWRKPAMKAGFAGDEQSRFMAWMSEGSVFADIILLLIAATNLSVLELEIPYDPMPWLRRVLQRQAHIQRASNPEPEGPLHKLRSVELFHSDTEGGFDPTAFAGFLHLPSLQHVVGFMCAGGPGFDGDDDSEDEDEEEDSEQPNTVWPGAGSSNVTNISLVDSLVTAEGVGQLLSCSNAIKSFEYRPGSTIVGSHEISWAGLWPHLYPLGHSLEDLTINLEEYDVYMMDDEPPPRLVLRHFPHLKRLTIPQVFLFPPSDLHVVDPLDARWAYTTNTIPLQPAPSEYRSIALEEIPASLESLTVLGSNYMDMVDNALDLLCFLHLLLPARGSSESTTATSLPLFPNLRRIDVKWAAFSSEDTVLSFVSSLPLHMEDTKKRFEQFNVEFITA